MSLIQLDWHCSWRIFEWPGESPRRLEREQDGAAVQIIADSFPLQICVRQQILFADINETQEYTSDYFVLSFEHFLEFLRRGTGRATNPIESKSSQKHPSWKAWSAFTASEV